MFIPTGINIREILIASKPFEVIWLALNDKISLFFCMRCFWKAKYEGTKNLVNAILNDENVLLIFWC